jgi:hypothetical protein
VLAPFSLPASALAYKRNDDMPEIIIHEMKATPGAVVYRPQAEAVTVDIATLKRQVQAKALRWASKQICPYYPMGLSKFSADELEKLADRIERGELEI